MRILLIPGEGVDPRYGGQGSFCRYLAEGLIEIGHSLQIAAGEEWAEFCRKWSIRLREVQGGQANGFDLVHMNGLGIRQAAPVLLRQRKVLVTHQDYRYMCPAFIAWTSQGCMEDGACGPCAHCPNQNLRSRARLRFSRFIAARCSNVAVSQCVRRRLALPNSSVVLNPTRAEGHSAPKDSSLIAFAGRLVAEKGLEVILRALPKLDGVRLEIAGDGPLLPELKRLTAELGLQHRVQFLGLLPLDGVLDLYRRSAAVCVPSIWPDPCPLAAVEALSVGRALVTSDRGGLPELAGEDRGWICKAENPNDWAETIRWVLEDNEERVRRQRRAAEFVAEELSPRRVAERYVALYEKSLGGTQAI